MKRYYEWRDPEIGEPIGLLLRDSTKDLYKKIKADPKGYGLFVKAKRSSKKESQ